MPLAWLLQSLLLFHCCGSSGSAVRASRYAHYTPPQHLVLPSHSLQRCGLQETTWPLAQLPISWFIVWKVPNTRSSPKLSWTCFCSLYATRVTTLWLKQPTCFCSVQLIVCQAFTCATEIAVLQSIYYQCSQLFSFSSSYCFLLCTCRSATILTVCWWRKWCYLSF